MVGQLSIAERVYDAALIQIQLKQVKLSYTEKHERTTKILGFSVPPAVVMEVESLAKEEGRTKSELFREMVRVYHRFRRQRDRDETRWVANLIQEAKAEQSKKPMTADEILGESERLARTAAKQAKKLGIKTDSTSVNHLIHERRKIRRSA
jgi:metal-responsive CopG/Arc/MetJ family transcriptional regulator